jgi:hypothetical protein
LAVRGYHTTSVIAAPPGVVWAVLTDVEAFPEWNPLLQDVRGTPAPGARLRLRVVPLGRDYSVRVVAFEPPRRLSFRRWELLPLVLASTHYLILEPTSEGHTRLQHGERFTGLGAFLLRPLLLDRMHQAFIHHDLVLKQWVEGGST